MKIAVLGAALCAAMTVNALEKPADFTSQTPLTLIGQGPLYRIELPLALQLNARQANLNDLRVFNADGQAQALALVRKQESHEENPAPKAVKWFPLYTTAEAGDAVPVIRSKRSSDGALIDVQPQSDIEAGEEILRGWLLDTSTIKAPLEQLLIDWSAEREGFQHFSIEASDDLQHWQAWGEGQVARLTFSDEMVEQREVGLPGQNARYLRLLWRSPQNAPTLISAHVMSASPDSPPTTLSWSPTIVGVVGQPNEYVWQLPVDLPVERVKIDISQDNSLAPGTLYGRLDGSQEWQIISSGLLYRLTQNNGEIVQDQLQLSGQSVRQLKLVVDDRGGGLGAQAPGLSVAVPATQVVFRASGNGPFTLAIGHAAAPAVELPLTALIPDFDPQKLTALGKARPAKAPAASAAVAAPPAAESMDYKRMGLWAVLILGTLCLSRIGLSALRASKH
ncbi:DUF3999 domain-containing protein [Pseudomonas sp. Irchel 3A18]|uniref:DUF3999 domain-containing protein n=1 Tax=Pseudomonas sp. Irchel 3A18 TaxID=2008905 RepID=UPI002113C128|nr:DUF3999 domain-containing protein [Pseudomonas sp. Irchel 3A18]